MPTIGWLSAKEVTLDHVGAPHPIIWKDRKKLTFPAKEGILSQDHNIKSHLNFQPVSLTYEFQICQALEGRSLFLKTNLFICMFLFVCSYVCVFIYIYANV